MDGGATLSIEVGDGRAGAAEIYLNCADADAEHARAVAAGLSFDCPPRDEDYLWRCARITDPSDNRIPCTSRAAINDPRRPAAR